MARYLPSLIATVVGTVVAATGLFLDWSLLPGRRALLYSDLFAGGVAGLLTYIAMWHQRARHQALMARLRVIAEMNHHIRNAITPLLYSAHLRQDRELIQLTQAAAERIDWALREVLPMDNSQDVAQHGTSDPETASGEPNDRQTGAFAGG